MSVTASFSREKKGFCPQPLKQGNPQAWQCVDYVLWCDWVDRWVVLYDITTVVVQQGPFNFGAVQCRRVDMRRRRRRRAPLLATSSWDIYKSSKAYKLETMLVSCHSQMSLTTTVECLVGWYILTYLLVIELFTTCFHKFPIPNFRRFFQLANQVALTKKQQINKQD